METGVASSRTAFVSVSGVTYCRAISLPLLRNGIEELGHAGCEGFAGELADGVSLVVFGENLVQFGLSGVLHLDIFLVVGSIELVPAHIDI